MSLIIKRYTNLRLFTDMRQTDRQTDRQANKLITDYGLHLANIGTAEGQNYVPVRSFVLPDRYCSQEIS